MQITFSWKFLQVDLFYMMYDVVFKLKFIEKIDLVFFCQRHIQVVMLSGTATGQVFGFISVCTSGVPSSFSLSTVDRFGNMLQGRIFIRAFESSSTSSINAFGISSMLFTFDKSSTQFLSFSSQESGTVSVSTTVRSSESRRLSIQSWFLDGPKGLSSTYYADCSWSVPQESILSSLPRFRPIGSAFFLNSERTLNAYPCSAQWSGMLKIHNNASRGASVSFELRSSRGSCLSLFINDTVCCGTCLNPVFDYNGVNAHRLGYIPCKCTFEVQGSVSIELWQLSIYGNSDGNDPNWYIKWFLNTTHRDGLQPLKDSDVMPTSTWESSILVLPGNLTLFFIRHFA